MRDMKKIVPTFEGEVHGGQLKVANPDRLRKWLSGLEGSKVSITIKKFTRRRSVSQNAYYWGIIIEILRDHIGYDPDQMHEALKWKFLQIRHSKLPSVRSTASMSTVEFSTYIDDIKMWAASELEIMIPDPNQVEI